MIKCLAEEVQASLRSGVAISSLGQCIEELALNSIDAKATCVAIRVDLETFKIQVVDNGSGMGKEDLNTVGNRYFTSKCCSVTDLENGKFYGFRGEALASIANMATIVEISSKTNKVAKTFLKLFHNGKGLEVTEAELNRPSAGTTVSVYNLFHQLPVRRKCMDSILEFERVRHQIEALALMHPSVSFSLRNDASCSVVLQLSKTKDICSRFCQIYGLGKSQKLREISHNSGDFEISGYISSEGHYNKNMQFLYVNNRLVLKTRMHKLIDFLLRKQSIICKTKSGTVTSSPARYRSGPELYGIFIINVKCPRNEYDVCLEPAKTLIEFRRWDALLTCMEEGVKVFLKQEHLFIELCCEDIKEFNDFGLGKTVALQPSLPEEPGRQECFKRACDNIVDSYEMFNLQSKSVKRKTMLVKASGHTDATSDVEETNTSPDVMEDKVLELSSSKVENLLPNRIGNTLDLPKLSNQHQEPEMFDNPQVVNINCEFPEKLCAQVSSNILETHNCVVPLSSKKYDKDENSQHQESSPKTVTLGCTEEAMKDVNEFKCDFLSGRILDGKCDTMKDYKGPLDRSDSNGRGARGQEPLMLCSTGLITHLRQNQSPHKTGISVSSRQPRKGLISAKGICENNLGFSEQILGREECLRMTKERMCLANANGLMKIGNVSGSKKNEGAFIPADGSGEHVTSHLKERTSVGPSGSVHNVGSAAWRQQTADFSSRPKPCTFTKLSLHPKMGSLERFRRCYGSINNTPPITDVEERNKVAGPVSVRSRSYETEDPERSAICKTSVKEYAGFHNRSCDRLPLEKSQHFSKESLVSRKPYVRETPLTLQGYSQSRQEILSGTGFKGTLASKISRMKGSLEKASSVQPAGQPSDQPEVHSNPKDKDKWDQSSQNHVLQSTCQTLQLSTRKIGIESHCFASTSDKQDNPLDICSTNARNVEDMIHCSTDNKGGYIVSPNRSSALSNKEVFSENTCEDTGVLEGSSKQTVKACDVSGVILSSDVDDATDDANAAEKEEMLSHSSEWFHQFDISLGRTVYINKMTGLSTYISPPRNESQAVCTKDISTMAVSVIQENDGQENSLQSLFSEWNNPVFAHCSEVAVDVSRGQADNLAVKIHNVLYPYRFTKEMIDSVQVLNQVDNKFIACLINTRDEKGERVPDGNLLVLVDQHAAHERVRLEQLIADSYEKQPEALHKKKLLTSTVCPALEIEITEEQKRLLRCCQKSLEDLGLELSFPENKPSQILVGKVPLCFVEREANELRRGRQTVAKSIVQEFIREQVELRQLTGVAQGTLPLTILKVLASQACHGAIKFNDSLTLEECCQLMKALSCCQLPFQCAHGRPSMLPLADVDHLQQEYQPKPNLAKLRRMVKAWHRFERKEPH